MTTTLPLARLAWMKSWSSAMGVGMLGRVPRMSFRSHQRRPFIYHPAIWSLVEGGDRAACRVMMEGRGSPELGKGAMIIKMEAACQSQRRPRSYPGPRLPSMCWTWETWHPGQHFALAGGIGRASQESSEYAECGECSARHGVSWSELLCERPSLVE